MTRLRFQRRFYALRSTLSATIKKNIFFVNAMVVFFSISYCHNYKKENVYLLVIKVQSTPIL